MHTAQPCPQNLLSGSERQGAQGLSSLLFRPSPKGNYCSHSWQNSSSWLVLFSHSLKVAVSPFLLQLGAKLSLRFLSPGLCLVLSCPVTPISPFWKLVCRHRRLDGIRTVPRTCPGGFFSAVHLKSLFSCLYPVS